VANEAYAVRSSGPIITARAGSVRAMVAGDPIGASESVAKRWSTVPDASVAATAT
jgi:hypothetical protein